MDSLSEYQDIIQSTAVSDADANEAHNGLPPGSMRNCDCCKADFFSNAPFITICQDCRDSVENKVNNYDQNDAGEKSSANVEATTSSTIEVPRTPVDPKSNSIESTGIQSLITLP